MQNYYGIERSIQERTQEARALAELQALRRKAVGARRTERLAGLAQFFKALFAERDGKRQPAGDIR